MPDAVPARGGLRASDGGQAVAPDRRKTARRGPVRGRALPQGSARFDAPSYFIPREWLFMAPALAAAVTIMGFTSNSLPDARELALSALAVCLGAGARWFRRMEREVAQGFSQRLAVMLIAVALPMLLFGLALVDWTNEAHRLPWAHAIGVMATISLLASVVLTGRLLPVVAASIALWLPAVFMAAAPSTLLVLTSALLMVVVAIRRQMRIDRLMKIETEALRRRQSRAEDILRDYELTGQGWFWETDRRGMVTYVSDTVGKVLGRAVEDLVGRPFTELFLLDVEEAEGERTLNFHLTARSSFTDLAVHAATTREERWWSISGRPVHDSYRNFLGFRGSGTDLTEMRRSQLNETRLAHYDSLTGLANRFQMSQTLEKILGALNPDYRACAVFLLDLDRFKQVNDTMGHPVGDALLKQVAERLEWTVGDAGRVGRLGGDEFKVILPGRFAREDLAGLATRIIENLSQPYVIESNRVVIGASVGIALSPDDGVTSEALIRNADLALYAAKDGGRGRYHFYAADLHLDAEERRQLEADLRTALSEGGLELYYQPVVRTTTEKITGFEALLRWTHPRLGPLSPTKFVPIAEETGLIAQIGEWALRTACRDLAAWPDDVRVAVNVSPLQFANPALPSIVMQALAQAQVAPSRLELEITESVFLNDDAQTEAMFAALKRVGVRLALDDFGTGYSSLGYLKQAPFDKIKIDRSFVSGATRKGSRNGAIIASIVSLAEALGMETTAEGVETLDELDLVRALGCSHVQGYIYEKPLTAQAASARLAAGLRAIASGPRSARASRQTMLRRVVLENGGQDYDATIRNISSTGAMVEGLWNVPAGTRFRVRLGGGLDVGATARWCRDDRMGVEFDAALPLDETGRVNLAPPRRREPVPPGIDIAQRKAG